MLAFVCLMGGGLVGLALSAPSSNPIRPIQPAVNLSKALQAAFLAESRWPRTQAEPSGSLSSASSAPPGAVHGTSQPPLSSGARRRRGP